MPWHLSKSDPRKVYDTHHNAVCVCQNADQAKLIAHAVNALAKNEAIKLREPSVPAGKESAEDRLSAGGASGHAKADAPLDTFDHDECCGKHLSRALRNGMKGDDWLCPSCGCEWKAEARGPLRHWTPVTMISLLRI
jgi:hypothetical protein